jgi:hypothetical protein
MRKNGLQLMLLLAVVVSTTCYWGIQRRQRELLTETLNQTRSAMDARQREMAAATKELEKLRHDIAARADALDARLKALMQQQSAAMTGEPEWAGEAELPYRWNEATETVRLGKRFLSALGLNPLAESKDQPYILDEVTATLLSLSPDETIATQAAIDRMVAQQHQIELARLEITDQPYDSGQAWILEHNPDFLLTFQLPAFPDEGAQVRSQFISDLTRAIGPARAEIFIAMAESQLRSDFGNFGAEARHITFWERLAPDGLLTLSWLDETDGAHYNNTSTSVQADQLSETRIAPIPARWRHLVAEHYRFGQSLDQRDGD